MQRRRQLTERDQRLDVQLAGMGERGEQSLPGGAALVGRGAFGAPLDGVDGHDLTVPDRSVYGGLARQTGLISPGPPRTADPHGEAGYRPDKLWFQTLIAGTTNLCWDGQFFFDVDHLWGSSGAQSNKLTSPAVAPATPTAAEFKTAYNKSRTTMLAYKRDNGEPYIRPVLRGNQQFVILVPLNHQQAAEDALYSLLLGGGNTNIVLDRPRIVATPMLTATDTFYLFNTDGPLKPFVFQARKALTRQMKGLTDIEFRDVKFMTEARYNVGYLAWWNAVQMQFV